jgi:hypothetical protein
MLVDSSARRARPPPWCPPRDADRMPGRNNARADDVAALDRVLEQTR